MATDVTMERTAWPAIIQDRMPFFHSDRLLPRSKPRCATWIALCAAALSGLCAQTHAQLSLTSAVDLALRSNPRVLSAQAEVRRARAVLAETHDAYIPNATFSSNVGQAYGYVPYPPTLFGANAGSLVYSGSQRYYIDSARAGLEAAQMSLRDVSETVAQDTALSFLAFDHDQQRARAIHQQLDYANRLAAISQDRQGAGQDSRIDLTEAKITAAQFKFAAMRADDELENERAHLARLIGLPADSLTVDGSFPVAPVTHDVRPSGPYANDAIAAAFLSAEAKEKQAKGDARVRFWPTVNLVVNYQRYATFTDSFKNLDKIYVDPNNKNRSLLTANETAFGIQVNLPFFDKTRSDKAKETAAEAARDRHNAENAQLDALDGQGKLRRSIDEIQVQADLASLQQQFAQQQLEVVQQQLQSGNGNPNGPQMTPKDEQKARIDEREKYIAVLDASFNLHQTEIQLLRQTGQLITWLGAGNSLPGGRPEATAAAPPSHP